MICPPRTTTSATASRQQRPLAAARQRLRVALCVGLLCAASWPLAGWAQGHFFIAAPPALSGSGLPMRNLQIEVRQVRQDGAVQSGGIRQGQISVGPGGAQASVQLQGAGTQQRNQTLAQRALVLNGQAVRLHLGNQVPLRVWQPAWGNAGPARMTVVMLSAQSGFDARPRWLGGDSAEVELTAVQSSPANAGNQSGYPSRFPGQAAGQSTASAQTVLVLPLDQWVTVAASDESSVQEGTGGAGTANALWRVELRLSAP